MTLVGQEILLKTWEKRPWFTSIFDMAVETSNSKTVLADKTHPKHTLLASKDTYTLEFTRHFYVSVFSCVATSMF